MKRQITLAGYTSLGVATGRPLFVSNDMLGIFQRVDKEYRTNYHMASIKRTLMAINADAIRGQSLNPAGDTRTIVCGHITMKYLPVAFRCAVFCTNFLYNSSLSAVAILLFAPLLLSMDTQSRPLGVLKNGCIPL